MKLGRRDLFKFAGGSAAGILFTPVPWRLLDDVAVWSQNWGWIPKPPEGEPTARFTTCTLCPAGCSARARCVGGHTVSLAGVEHPLCPAGILGHHLRYHPGRVRQTLYRGKPSTADAAVEAVKKVVAAGGTVAVLDQQPGRTASAIYRRFAEAHKGVYLTPPDEGATLAALREMAGCGPLGLDLENTKTILSFGAPVLDGWPGGAPVAASRERYRIVQAEPRQSRTAMLADEWLPVRPGAEAALALGIASALVEEKLYDRQAASKVADFAECTAALGQFTPEQVAAATGLNAARIREASRALAANRPAVAVGGGDPGAGPLGRAAERAIAGLNVLLGSVGTAVVPRREGPPEPGAALESLADGSLSLLLIDEAVPGNPLPWAWLKRKLAPGALVVCFASTLEGYAKHADYVVAAPAYTESVQDTPGAPVAARASFTLSAALASAPQGTIEPADFVLRAAGESGTLADRLKERVSAIHKAGRGSVFTYGDAKSVPVKQIAKAEDLWKALSEGGRWTDEAGGAAPARFRLLDRSFEAALAVPGGMVLLPSGSRAATGPLSPLMTKLYQESGVRNSARQARMNPETARQCGVDAGDRVRLETSCGSGTAAAELDEGVMPGVVEVAVDGAPAVLDICTVTAGCTWRTAPVKVVKA